MRYVEAKFVEREQELAYRIYVTDALKFQCERYVEDGEVTRFADLILPTREEKETRTPEEIIDSIKSKISMLGGGNSGRI